jgi:hypothetical protein
MSRIFDDFASLDTARWQTEAGTGASVAVASSLLTLTGASGGAAIAYYKTPVDKTKSQTYQALFRRSAGSGANGGMVRVVDTNGGGLPTIALSSDAANRRIDLAYGTVVSVDRMRARYRSSTDVLTTWDEVDNAWVTSAIDEFFDLINNNWYEIMLEIDGSDDAFFVSGGGFRVSITGRAISGTTWSPDQGLKWFTQTAWVPWSSLDTPQADMYFGFQVDANASAPVIDVEYFSHSFGETVWLAENILASTYLVALARAHDITGPYQHVERTAIAMIPTGGAGSYDENETRNPSGVIGSDGIWRTFYTGSDAGVLSFNLVTHAGAGPHTTPTKHANNPLIASGAAFPFVFEDLVEADSNKRWKAFIHTSTGIKFAYAANAHGPWTLVGTAILTTGAGGQWDDTGVGYPVGVIYKATGYLFYGGWQAAGGTHRVGVATTTDLVNWTGLSKYGSNPVVPSTAALATLTGPINGMSATVGAGEANAFTKGDHVVIARAGQPGSDDTYNRVRSISGGNVIEFYHRVAGGASGDIIIGYQQGNVYPRDIRKVGSRWYLTCVSLNHDLSSGTHAANQESTKLFYHDGDGPNDAAWIYDRWNTPVLYGRDNAAEGSNENQSWYRQAVSSYGSGSAAARAMHLRMTLGL